MLHHYPRHCIFLTCAALAAAVGGVVAQQIEKPLKNGAEKTAAEAPASTNPVPQPAVAEVESKERQMTASAALHRIEELEKEVAALKAKAEVTGEKLGAVEAEAQEYKEDYGRMRLQMEALGIAALSGDERSLQLRLLNAVNDYRLAEKEKQQLSEQLIKISEAALAYLKSADVTNRQRLEAAVREAADRLHETSDQKKPVPTPLETAKVVSYKPDLDLAVVNAGRESGLRLGMPLRFIRDDHAVASGVIVDCRDQITGVLITTTEKESESVAVGDAIKLEPTKKAATKE